MAAALGAGYLAGHEPPPRETGPGAALRAFQRARVDAIGECAKYGYSTQWGDLAPNSKVELECLSLVSQPCTSVGVPAPPDVDEPKHGPRI